MKKSPTRICQFCNDLVDLGDPAWVVFSTCRRCLDDLKVQYNARTLVGTVLPGHYRKSHARYDEYVCYKHDDHHPSLMVYDDHLMCVAGCTINNRRTADIFDFAMDYFGLDMTDAIAYVNGNVAPEPVAQQYDRKLEVPRTPLSMRDIEALHIHAKHALPWFASRCITPFSVEEKRFGMNPAHSHTHTFRAGPMQGQKVKHATKRYSIPNIAFGQVRYCKLRRDDAYTDELFALLDPKVVDAVREEYAVRGRTASDEDVKDELFGGRFTQLPNPANANAIYNVERVVRRTGDQFEFQSLPYLLIHEGELKAQAMEDAGDGEYGYPSVGNKDNKHIADIVRNVERVIYVEDAINGEKYADQHRQWIPNLEVIRAPDGLKAADDAVKAGVAHDWMASHGIEPVRLRTRHV